MHNFELEELLVKRNMPPENFDVWVLLMCESSKAHINRLIDNAARRAKRGRHYKCPRCWDFIGGCNVCRFRKLVTYSEGLEYCKIKGLDWDEIKQKTNQSLVLVHSEPIKNWL